MLTNHRIIFVFFILIVLCAPTANALEIYARVEVNPGTPGGIANDLVWGLVDETAVVDLVFSDYKTCEFPPDLHTISVVGAPGVTFVGALLDATFEPIPGTELFGDTQTSTDPIPLGFIDLSDMSGTTVFSGIRLIATFGFPGSGWEMTWVSSGPTVGQGLVFLDDFESGDTSAWSETVP